VRIVTDAAAVLAPACGEAFSRQVQAEIEAMHVPRWLAGEAQVNEVFEMVIALLQRAVNTQIPVHQRPAVLQALSDGCAAEAVRRGAYR
jgi:hypothetical protein